MTRQGTIQFYEEVDWERMHQVTPTSIREYVKAVHRYLLSHIRGNVLILDVGCGTGDFIKEIARQVDKIVGVDASSKLISIARQNLKDISNISLIQGDIDSIKIPKEYFNFIISLWTLPNIDDPIPFIKKIKPALKQGGVIYIDTYSELATEERIKMYKKYGLTVLGHNEKEIIIKEGLTEKIYTQNDLEILFRSAGMLVEIIPLHKFGYLCKSTKK